MYLEDGAIEAWQLTGDGRHCVDSDEESWHFLSVEGDKVLGCARLRVFEPTIAFSALAVAQSAQAQCSEWGSALRLSIAAELQRAQAENILFIEAGGWALLPELRCTTEALHIALGSYAFGELLGGCLGLSTATVRHGSASILRRLGGSSLMWEDTMLPPYYDSSYRCEMEVVRFDSRSPSAKFRAMVDKLRMDLLLVPVVCRV
ncbi:hypothetical protein [uncultured Paludibaculum sp.]|uniref:hypothetical protein n=1 Tax=uncultured Paludibaculum sp. TaxID=1765020 RepID=UPI002AAABFDD|nr:hypothetical protein [uncultured Paludibaculum sp.]